MFNWLKKLFPSRKVKTRAERKGFVTITCRKCGKKIIIPENVQHWPDLCQECRAKYRLAEPITRKCRRCGKTFTFQSDAKRWPKYCPECRAKTKEMRARGSKP